MPEPQNWYKKTVCTFYRGEGKAYETRERTFYFITEGDETEVNQLIDRAKGYFAEEGWKFLSSETIFRD